MFRLERLDPLLDAINILVRFGENGNIECCPSMFSIIVPHHYLELNVAFQMMPQFFNHFFSNNTHSSKILLQPLLITLKRMKQHQITSLSLFVLKLLHRLVLKFSSPRNELPLIRKFGMMCAMKEDMGNIDFGTFVSIDSQRFRRIVTECRDYFVRVTPTHSHVRFSNEIKEFIFCKEGGECIIGGVGKGAVTEFLIPIYPTHIFYNISFQAERVWLFKSSDNRGWTM